VAEDRGDVEATRALHVHEVAVRALYKPLELVLLLLQGGVRVKKVILKLRGGRKVRPANLLWSDALHVSIELRNRPSTPHAMH